MGIAKRLGRFGGWVGHRVWQVGAIALLLVGVWFIPSPAQAQPSVPSMAPSDRVLDAEDGDPRPPAASATPQVPLRIDGAPGLEPFTRALQQAFEAEFPDRSVSVAVQGSEAALQALMADEVDVVGLERSLTPAEKAQGLKEFALPPEDVAFVVGDRNPLQVPLTVQQVTQIFQGAITNWSDVGGSDQPIRVVEQAAPQATRQALYQAGLLPETPMPEAVVLETTNLRTLARTLGRDGIGYAIAHHLSAQPKLRPIPLLVEQDTLPSEIAYPYRLTRALAYADAALTDDTRAFLGFLTHAGGQGAIAQAQQQEAQPKPRSTPVPEPTPSPSPSGATVPAEPTAPASPETASSPDPARLPASSEPSSAAASPEATPSPQAESSPPPARDQPQSPADASPALSLPLPIWLTALVPVLGVPVAWLLRRRFTPKPQDVADSATETVTPTDSPIEPSATEAQPSTSVPDPWNVDEEPSPGDIIEEKLDEVEAHEPEADQTPVELDGSVEPDVMEGAEDSFEAASSADGDDHEASEPDTAETKETLPEATDETPEVPTEEDSPVEASDEGEGDRLLATAAATMQGGATYTEPTESSLVGSEISEDAEAGELAELRQENQRLQQALEQAGAEREAAIAPLQEALSTTQRDNATLSAQVSHLQGELDRLRTAQDLAERNLAAIRDETEQQATALYNQLAEAQTAHQTAQAEASAEIARLNQLIQEGTTGALLAALEYAEAEKTRLQQELEDARSHVHYAQLEKNAAEAELAGLQDALTEARSQADDATERYQQELEHLQTTQANLQQDRDALHAQVEALTAEIQSTQTTVETLHQQVHAADQERDRQQQRIAELQAERDANANQLAALNAQLTAQEVELASTLARLHGELEAARTGRQQLEEDAIDLRRRLEAVRVEKGEVDVERQSLQEQLNGLEAEHTRAQETLNRLQGQVSTLQADNHTQATELDDLRTQLETLSTDLAEREAAQDHLNRMLDEAQTAKTARDAEFQQLQHDWQAMRDRQATVDADVQRLRQEISELTDMRDALQHQLETSHQERDRLTPQLDALQAEKADLEQRLATVQQQAESQSALETLEAEHTQLQTQLQAEQSAKETLEQRLTALQAEHAQTQANLETVERDRTQLQRQLTALQAEHSEAQTQLESALAAARADLEALTTETKRLEAALVQAQTASRSPRSRQPGSRRKTDSLSEIPGIGETYEKRLKAAGIKTFTDLAQQTPERVQEIVSPNVQRNLDTAAWIAAARDRQNA